MGSEGDDRPKNRTFFSQLCCSRATLCDPINMPSELLSSTRIACILCLVILACYGYQFLNQTHIMWVLKELETYPIAGTVVYIILSTTAIVLLLPGMVLSLLPGAVYGVVAGFLVTWVSTVGGQTIAFLLGRYLLRGFVVEWLVSRVQNFHLIENKISEEGWKLVVLLRLSPLIPYNILNYLLSVTSIDLWSYTVASGFAIIPYTIAFVYIGSMSHDLSQIFSGKAAAEGLATLGPFWIGITFVIMVVTVVYASVLAKATLQALLQASESAEGLHVSSPHERL